MRRFARIVEAKLAVVKGWLHVSLMPSQPQPDWSVKNVYQKMNQHYIQKAYLKNFQVNGKIWVFNKEKGTYDFRPSAQCAAEEDFQSEELEEYQNKQIESPGIPQLRNLEKQIPPSAATKKAVLDWSTLHLLRNKKIREKFVFNSEGEFRDRLSRDIDKANQYYKHFSMYNCENEDYFVTSDNPIIEINIEEDMLRAMVWSPKTAFLFSPTDKIPSHELSIPDQLNSMCYHTCFKELFSKHKDIPIERYKEIGRKYEFVHNFNSRNAEIYKKSLASQPSVSV